MIDSIEPRLDPPPEPKIRGYCHVCGDPIYEWEQYAINDDRQMIHLQDWSDDDCINDEWDHLTAEEKAEMLGYEVIRCE